MTAPVRRPSIPAAVGENRNRIRILEAAVPSSGCYVFLDEAVSVDGDESLAITGIDQSYRHLVFELQISALLGLETPPSTLGSLTVSFDHEYTYAPQMSYADPVDPTSPIATLASANGDPATMLTILTYSDWAIANGPGYATYATFKLPYYTEATLANGCLWSAVSFGSLVEPSGSGGTLDGGAFSTGGFITDPELGAITEMTVSTIQRDSTVYLGAYNSLTVYVPGDLVLYLGSYWVSLTGSVGVQPQPISGGVAWLSLFRQLTVGSRLSVYGVC